MKNLKTTIFSVALLGTTFVALGYWCERCHTNHESIGECTAFACSTGKIHDEIIKEYIADFVKEDEIIRRQLPFQSYRPSFQSSFSLWLELKEFEMRHGELIYGLRLNSPERAQQLRKFLEDAKEDINGRIRDYYTSHNLCGWEPISDWSEVFGSDCETTPALPNHGDGWNEVSNEPDPWDSGYASSPFGC